MFQGWWIVGTHFTVQLFVVGFFTYSYPLLFDPVLKEFETDAQTMNYLPSLGGAIGLIAAPLAGEVEHGFVEVCGNDLALWRQHTPEMLGRDAGAARDLENLARVGNRFGDPFG